MSGRTFGIIPAGMAFDPELGKVALRVGMLLAVHASKSRKCWLATETMARLLEIDRSAVSRALAELRSRGHVTRARRSIPGRGLTSSVYTLVNRPWLAPEIVADDEGSGTAGETACPEPKGLGGALNQSAGLGAEFAPPAPANVDPVVREPHQRPRPGGADFAHPAGAKTADPVVQNSHQNQYGISISDQDDEERAPAREASASALDGEILTEEDEAAAIFNESARRMGWRETRHLTKCLREQIAACLAHPDVGGLAGWAGVTARAERSNFLTRKLPRNARRLAWLVREDNFAALMDGTYDSDNDPPLRGVALKMANIAALYAGSQHEPERPVDYTPPRAPAPATEPEARQVVSRGCSRPIPIPAQLLELIPQAVEWVATTGGHDKAKIEAAASLWMKQLMATGFDEEEARAVIVYEARWVRKVRTNARDPAAMLAARIATHAPAPAAVAA